MLIASNEDRWHLAWQLSLIVVWMYECMNVWVNGWMRCHCLALGYRVDAGKCFMSAVCLSFTLSAQIDLLHFAGQVFDYDIRVARHLKALWGYNNDHFLIWSPLPSRLLSKLLSSFFTASSSECELQIWRIWQKDLTGLVLIRWQKQQRSCSKPVVTGGCTSLTRLWPSDCLWPRRLRRGFVLHLVECT